MFPRPRSSTLSWCTVPATAPGAGSSLRACSRAPPTASPASTPTTSDRSMTTTRRSSSSWRPPTRSWPPYLSYHIYYVKHVFINNLKPWLIQSIICWIYSTRSILNNLHVLMQSIISSLGISKGFYLAQAPSKCRIVWQKKWRPGRRPATASCPSTTGRGFTDDSHKRCMGEMSEPRSYCNDRWIWICFTDRTWILSTTCFVISVIQTPVSLVLSYVSLSFVLPRHTDLISYPFVFLN